MGSLSSVMKMLPGMSGITDKQLAAAEKQFAIYESMINSMTAKERTQPELLAKSVSRRRRVARGSGRTEKEVADLMGVFTRLRMQMQSVTKMMAMGGALPPGMMNDDDIMNAMMSESGPRPIPGGMVRRKKKGGKKGGKKLVNSTGNGFGGGGSRR